MVAEWLTSGLKGVQIAKFLISTSEYWHETLIIGFLVPYNPGSNGRNNRFAHQREIGAIFVVWRVDFM